MKPWVVAWCFLARSTFFLKEGSAYISCALQTNEAMGGGLVLEESAYISCALQTNEVMGGGLVFFSEINFLSNGGIYIHFLCTE